jgi:hypothetical protein
MQLLETEQLCMCYLRTGLAGDDSDFVGLGVQQTWVLLVGRTISAPSTTTILSVRVQPALYSETATIAVHCNRGTVN